MIEALIIGIIALYAYAAYRAWRESRQQSDEDYAAVWFDSVRLAKEIDALHRRVQELESIDEMLIDLRLCKPDAVQRAFRMEWQSTTGTKREYDLFADGGNTTTEHLLAMAEDEREQINAEIMQMIYDLYLRACAMEAYEETG